MKQLIFVADSPSLDTGLYQEVKDWADIYKLITSDVNIIDRCDYLKMPFNFKSIFPMPSDLSNFNKSYKEICLDRAQQIIDYSKKINKPIVVLYSGGIDSTVVVLSLMLAANGDYSNIKIALNTYSIRENPKFYYEHIRNKFEMIPSESAVHNISSDCIIVGGEGNDQLFGTDVYKKFRDYASIEELYQPYNEKNITDFFKSAKMSEQGSKIWYSLMDEQIRNTRRCEITTIKDFLWWYNFCYKFQSVYFRIPARSATKEVLNADFLNTYYFQFFITDDFQKWSMLNPDKKIDKTWASYKKAAKEFIYEFTNDNDYFLNKTKIQSLMNIIRKRIIASGITDNFEILKDFNPEDYYNHHNSFKI
jgi:hypothetical protein